MDPVAISVAGVPGWAVLGLLTLAAAGVFGGRLSRWVGLLRQARTELCWDQPGRRMRHVLRHVLGQPRLVEEPVIGLAHWLIFYGFVLYAVAFVWSLVRGLLPGTGLPYPEEVPLMAWGLEVTAGLVLVAVGVAAVRRRFFAPPHLHRSADANAILGLIAFLMLTTVLGSAFRLVEAGRSASVWAPLSSGVATGLSGLSPEVARNWSVAMWWGHILGVLGFLAYLPFSKHLHLLVAPLNVFLAQAAVGPVGGLEPRSVQPGEDIASGATEWRQLTWKQLLGGLACAECGRCDRACPATASGMPLQPQQLWQKIKRHVWETGQRTRRGKSAGRGATLVGEVLTPAELWSCATCLACMARCALWNEHVPLIVTLRRALVSRGEVDRGVQATLARLQRYGNSFGKSPRVRARWAQELGLPLRDARREPVDCVWFVGDYASFDPRCEPGTRQTAWLLTRMGLEVGLLYEDEWNAGNDVRRIGEEGLFEMLRDKNLEAFGKVKWKNAARLIVTTDPHAYHTLKNEYAFDGAGRSAGPAGVVVKHSAELLDQWIQAGRLPLKKKLAGRVTYHDPCYLGRYNGIYDPPRRILKALGLELVEMPRNRTRSYCCGAGGGRIWMEDTPDIKERPAEHRLKEAAALGDVPVLVVACPKDIVMFRDAVKTTGNEGRIAVKDLAELVAEAMAEPEPKPA